jgi:hypothetical protein
MGVKTFTATLGSTNLAEWPPPDWSTSRQPSPGGPAARQRRTAQGSMQRLTLASRPTTESASCVCTSWRDGARRHCSAETGHELIEWLIVTRPVKKLLTFCIIQRLITIFTRASHWALSTTNTFPEPTSLRTIPILTSHLWIDVGAWTSHNPMGLHVVLHG